MPIQSQWFLNDRGFFFQTLKYWFEMNLWWSSTSNYYRKMIITINYTLNAYILKMCFVDIPNGRYLSVIHGDFKINWKCN